MRYYIEFRSKEYYIKFQSIEYFIEFQSVEYFIELYSLRTCAGYSKYLCALILTEYV